MARVKYQDVHFNQATRQKVHQAQKILEEYQARGYTLTTRQLYYRFVDRDLLLHTDGSYDVFRQNIELARDAGLIDWDCSCDGGQCHWNEPQGWPTPAQAILAHRPRVDMWANQQYRPELWVENFSIIEGTLGEVVKTFSLPVTTHFDPFSNRCSLRCSAQRLLNTITVERKRPKLLFLGDCDSFSHDNENLFSSVLGTYIAQCDYPVQRVALNPDQARDLRLPSRPGHADAFELESLEPQILSRLIEDTVAPLIDTDQWEQDLLRAHVLEVELQRIAEGAV